MKTTFFQTKSISDHSDTHKYSSDTCDWPTSASAAADKIYEQHVFHLKCEFDVFVLMMLFYSERSPAGSRLVVVASGAQANI